MPLIRLAKLSLPTQLRVRAHGNSSRQKRKSIVMKQRKVWQIKKASMDSWTTISYPLINSKSYRKALKNSGFSIRRAVVVK